MKKIFITIIFLFMLINNVYGSEIDLAKNAESAILFNVSLFLYTTNAIPEIIPIIQPLTTDMVNPVIHIYIISIILAIILLFLFPTALIWHIGHPVPFNNSEAAVSHICPHSLHLHLILSRAYLYSDSKIKSL